MKTHNVTKTRKHLRPDESTFGPMEPNEAAASAPLTASVCSAPGSSNTLTPTERHRIESLKRKQRSDSFLQKLSDDQIAKILLWFEDEEDVGMVYHHITSPAPEGLGLDVSITSVRRLRAHVTATHANQRATEILDTIIDMESIEGLSPSAQSERIQSAIYQLLHQKAFELVSTEPGSEELRDLLHTIEKLAALDLKRQQLALDREKMIRRDQRATTPPSARRHHVKLEVLPSTPTTTSALPPHNSPSD